MSLRALARTIGVSPSFVLQLERNKTNASVGTLYALVDALGLSLDQLMAAEPAGAQIPDATRGPGHRLTDSFPTLGSGVHVSNLAPVDKPVQRRETRARIGFPGVVWERLTQAPDALVDFLHVRYEAGSSSCADDDMVRHGGREYGYVLSGRIKVQIGFDNYELAAGDAVTFDSMSPHRLSNPHDEPCEAVWLVLGRRDDDRAINAPSPGADVTHLPSMRT